MLYIGLAVGVVLGSFTTIIFLALFKEVSLEQESGSSPNQTIKHRKEALPSINTHVS